MASLAPHTTPGTVGLCKHYSHNLPADSLKPRSALKRTHNELFENEAYFSPSKKSRVTFDVEDESGSDEDDDANPYLVYEQVRRAISRHLAGTDDTAYEKVKKIFSADPEASDAPSSKTVYMYLRTILARVSSLEKQCNGLVNAIIDCEWVGRDEAFVSLYSKFLGNLGAAKSGYLAKLLHRLVELLGEQGARKLPGCSTVRQTTIHSRVRRAIADVLRVVPAASSTLVQVIESKLAKDIAKPRERLLYIKNFLHIVENAPELKAVILGIITCDLVKLDVSIQIDIEDYADDLGEEIVGEISSPHPPPSLVGQSSFEKMIQSDRTQASIEAAHHDHSDDETNSTTIDASDESVVENDPHTQRRCKVMEHLEVVDSVMDLLFDFYHPLVHSHSLEVCDDTMNLLTAHFRNLILPTYRSRHAQFLIFHFSQTSPVFVDKFATTCISTLLDHKEPAVLRQTAGSYLAGYVGRGAQVPTSVIGDCFRLLCDELESLRQQFEPSCYGPDLRRYTSFYCMMQAIMYIFCFRWQVLAEESQLGDDSDDEQEVQQYRFPYSLKENLVMALNSPLNPLRICSPDIVGQFATICHRLRFLYLFPKIENNKQIRLSNSRRHVSDIASGTIERDLGWVEDSGMLEAYFPFDPYRLPKSRKWVVDDYLEWKGLPEEDEDKRGDDTDEDFLNEDSSVFEEDYGSDEEA